MEASAWHPENFAEVRRLVDRLRRDYYLEGPNPVELHWVFPNQITQWREDNLYVGYTRDDQGGNHWVPPHVIGTSYHTPAVIDLARALHQTRATTPEGLSIVAEVWRPVEVRNEMRWLTEQRELNRKTLVELEDRGLVPASTQIDGEIWDNWVFPLWPLDLRMCRVDKEKLREQLSPIADPAMAVESQCVNGHRQPCYEKRFISAQGSFRGRTWLVWRSYLKRPSLSRQ